jgi:ribonuclease BN (tRNA processing enzyme)
MSEVVFVGTSDAFGSGGRRQSAVMLRLAQGGVLVDCGVTTCIGLVDLGIERDEIDSIVISHFHGDHYGGIPTILLAALYEDERKHPLRIVGPPGIEARVRELAHAMCYGIEDREWSFPIHFEEFQAGSVLEAGPVRVEAFEAKHQRHTRPHGLVLRDGQTSIAYSGDTGWFDELPRRVGESDLFICECTYHDFDFDFHLNHRQLVEHKHEFQCGRVVLTHLGSEMADRRGRAVFETADDGTVIRL